MKPNHLFLILLLTLSASSLYAQKTYPIALDDYTRPIPIENRSFYIARVIDDRVDTTNIGLVQAGTFHSQKMAMFYDDCSIIIKEYYDATLPKTENQVPITIRIKKLRIEERAGATDEHGWTDFEADFYSGNTLLYRAAQHKEYSAKDVTEKHAENIAAVLENAVIEFNNTGWQGKAKETVEPTLADTTARRPENASQSDTKVPGKEANGNVMAVGYQIGGIVLIGMEYEIRFHDYFGANLGIGFPGFTYGLKVHTRPGKNAGFFNISYKDGGFGLIHTAGVEYGGRLRFSRTGQLAFHYQAGLAKILYIQSDFAKQLYKGQPTPPLTLSFGAGLSW
jgi:hypothetical protein